MAPFTATQNKALAAKLGKETDTSLASKYNVSREYIRQLRVAADIPAFNSGPPMSTAWPVRFTKAAVRAIKRAMKVTGHTNRSEYIRDAVSEKNRIALCEHKGMPTKNSWHCPECGASRAAIEGGKK